MPNSEAEPERLSDSAALESYIISSAAGESEGLARLYEASRGAVYGCALAILKNVHDAEEVSQEVFVRVFRAAPDYEPRGAPMAWLMRIARNLSLDRLRERSRTAELTDGLEALSENPRVTAEDRLVLTSLMETLSDSERQIMALRAAGLLNREIASVMGLPLATVLSKHSRAVKKLQAAWRDGE